MNAIDIARLTEELDRVTAAGDLYTLLNGRKVIAETESRAIAHLTSKHDFVPGRKYRFPGIGNGWRWSGDVEKAGYVIVGARNSRNLPCRVLVRGAA